MEAEIDRSMRSLGNRVRSIIDDAEFIEAVAKLYKKPVVPNLRGGLWYVKPSLRSPVDAYFKSTDGHTNQCAFSLKRLNLHLLKLIEENKGVLLVDSTRRGKKVPDSFSKTVPIWCAVINYAVFHKLELFCPRNLVSNSEASLIESQIPLWTARFVDLVGKNRIPVLTKPLRPLYVFQNTLLPETVESDVFDGYNAVIMATASKQVQDGVDREMGYTYVQGAGDDHELWAPKSFDADILWSLDIDKIKHGVSESECLDMINSLLARNGQQSSTFESVQITPSITLATNRPAKTGTETVIDLKTEFKLSEGKKGARELAQRLPEICAYFESQNAQKVVIVSDSELGVAVALALDCKYFTPAGQRCPAQKYVSKESMQKRAVQVYANAGKAPSRITVNVVGNYLRL